LTGRVRARKSLGQHWLTDGTALRRIAEAGTPAPGDTILEIGAGTGLLTELLARHGERVVAVEVDERLAGRLGGKYSGSDVVSVVNADVLAVEPEELLARGGGRLPYVVVGNLPYFIGTAIVRRFLEARAPPKWLVVTLQAEVAESMAAVAGRMTALGVMTQILATVRIVLRLPPSAFTPAPKVRSAVVRLDVRDLAEVEVDDREAFFALVRAGFAAPRKKLRNSLAVGLAIGATEAEGVLTLASVDGERRPAELELMEWRSLYFACRSSQQSVVGDQRSGRGRRARG